MGDVKVITPPDTIYDHSLSLLLIYPSLHNKSEIQNLILKSKQNLNLYLYELDDQNQYIEWLLKIHRMSDFCFINLDNIIPPIRPLISYLISYPNTYWQTQGETNIFNLISQNQIFDFNILHNILGDIFEV